MVKKILRFVKNQFLQVRHGGIKELFKKLKYIFKEIYLLPLCILAFPFVLVIRLVKSRLIFRFGYLMSSRIGHFAGNTEILLCERDAGIHTALRKPHIDIFYLGYKPIANQQLLTMWKRLLRIWPGWIVRPITMVNNLIPGGVIHNITLSTQQDRDIYNLLDQIPPHLKFTDAELLRGESELRNLGVPSNAHFICLNVRDSAYLESQFKDADFSYHNYRDCNIENFILVAETLADLGFYVIRMGAKVRRPIESCHPRVIDYAMSTKRNDFMDIYLGAKCYFAISTSTGWDAIPYIFRRPICYVDMMPLGYSMSFVSGNLIIFKKLIKVASGKMLSVSEIFNSGLGFSLDGREYESKGVKVVENTPEEICDVAVEMLDRLNGVKSYDEVDEELQKNFWNIFPVDALDINGIPLHGKISGRIGSGYLRNNPAWVR